MIPLTWLEERWLKFGIWWQRVRCLHHHVSRPLNPEHRAYVVRCQDCGKEWRP